MLITSIQYIPPELSKIQTPLTTRILHWVSHGGIFNGQNRTFDYLKLLFFLIGLPRPRKRHNNSVQLVAQASDPG